MIDLDPLSGHADPRLYVPLDTSERALAGISAYLKQGRSPLLLTGPAGIGKTILLRVLADREWKTFPRVRFSPLLSLDPEDLSEWLLRLLFGKLSGGSADAEDALLEELRLSHAGPILLLVDNIQRTPAASVRKLSELAFASRPALAVIVAGTDDRTPSALAEAFAPEATVAFPDSLPDREIETLYETILDHPGLSARLRHRLKGVDLGEITRAAAGIPRLLKSDLVRRNEPRRAPPRELAPEKRKPHLEIVREPVAAALDLVDPPPPRAIPAPRPAARAAARFAEPVAIIGRVAGAAVGLLIGTCAFVAGVPPALAAALSHSGILGTARDTLSTSVVAIASARRNALRVAPIAAVPATALLALALFSSLEADGTGPQPSPSAPSVAVARLDVATPTNALMPVAKAAGAQALPASVNVQVNAQPWARVRINGVDVGSTPLSQRLAPGVYQLEAEFPSGERLERKIEVGPGSRFVSLREPAPKRMLQAATDDP